jgi:2-polyprenyl-3-methyl-5-hydroxy-6-metoxy-1,4-benzoquinol methylase
MNKEELIKKELIKTINNTQYNGWYNRTTYGYHSYNLDGINIIGQRNPKIRIEKMSEFIDFNNKKVIDFGCNVGSMLHHLDNIDMGLGFDYDQTCIEVANNISNILGRNNLKFIKHDFDKDLDLLSKIDFNPDIIFILSIGSWVKKWEDLYSKCVDMNCDIILETNNDSEGVNQLDFFKNRCLNIKLIIDNSKDDSTGNYGRKTYLINR